MKMLRSLSVLGIIALLSFQHGDRYSLRALQRWQSKIGGDAIWVKVDSAQWRCALPNGESHMMTIRRVNTCTFGGCIRPDAAAEASAGQEYLVYAAHIDGKTGTVREVRVLEYASTYGYQMTAKWWLRQFEGWSAASSKTQTIDGISGATVSVNAFVEDVHQLLLAQDIKRNTTE
ncbi:MAG: FMN-binding protein [Schleiferiaceae bacterium]|nr:FMN-binding protein [Schleiferiaceae bacterium]